MPPKIHTYHCHCTTLLLSTTYTLTSLPHRQSTSSEIILPIPATPLPNQGQATLHALLPDPKTIIIRKEDGFEKRVLYRCERCRLVVGYTILSAGLDGGEMDVDVDGGNVGGEGEGDYKGKVMYLLPGGLVSTEFMGSMGTEGGRTIREEDLEIGVREGGVVVFE